MSHLVRALIEDPEAHVLCPSDHGVDYLVLADIPGTKDTSKFGHEWVANGRPIYCVTQVLPAVEAEKEVA